MIEGGGLRTKGDWIKWRLIMHLRKEDRVLIEKVGNSVRVLDRLRGREERTSNEKRGHELQ